MDKLSSSTPLTATSDSSKQVETKPLLWAGEIVKGPITLYHGVGRQQDSREAFRILKRIVESERLAPKGFNNYPELQSVNILVYQHFLSHAQENPGTIKSIVYIQSQESQDPRFFAIAKESLEYRFDQNYPESHILKIDRMSDAGRDYTNHFTRHHHQIYGRNCTLQFDLTANDIEELDRENAGGNALYGQGEYLISPQPVPLKYATAIHFGTDPDNYDLFQLQVLLAEHHLSHIQLYSSKGALIEKEEAKIAEEVQKREIYKKEQAIRDLIAKKIYAFRAAFEKDNLDQIKLLLESDPPIEDEEFIKAVKYTACYGKLAILEYLLEKRSIPEEARAHALTMAASNGHLEVVRKLASTDVTPTDRWSAIYQAVQYNRLDVVEALLKDLPFDSKFFYWSISHATIQNTNKILEILIKKFPLNLIEKRFRIDLLKEAIKVNNRFVIEKLLECNDYTQKDLEDAVYQANAKGMINIVERLLEFGLEENDRTNPFKIIQAAANHQWSLSIPIALRELKYSFSNFIDSLE